MKLHIVPASRAALWVRTGLRTFWQQPLALLSLFAVVTAVVRLCGEIPVVGSVLGLALLPSVTLVLQAGSARVASGPTAPHLLVLGALHAVWQRLGALAVLGIFHAAGFMLALGLSALADGGSFARLNLQGGGALTQEMLQDAGFRNAALITLMAYIPVSMMLWHAPAWVYWHGISPFKSLFFSLVACLRNMGGLILFGLMWSGITFASILAASVAMMLVLAGTGNADARMQIGPYVMDATTLGVTAMFMVSTLFTFRDCFSPPGSDENDEATAAPAVDGN